MSLRERFGVRTLVDGAEAFRWFTIILVLVIAGLLSYALFSVFQAPERVDEGLLIRYTPLGKATLAILGALALYAICRRFDPLMARENFVQGLYNIGLVTLVLLSVLVVVCIPAIFLVGLARYFLAPFQQTLGILYSVMLWGIGIVAVGIAGWLFLRNL